MSAINTENYNRTSLYIDSKTYTAFSPAKKTGNLVFLLYGKSLEKAVDDVARTALEKVKKPPEHAKAAKENSAFVIRKTLVHSSINQSYEGSEEEGKAAAEKFSQTTHKTGLGETELSGCIKLAKGLALKFFSEDYYFSYAASKETIQNWAVKQKVEGLNFLYKSLGMKQSEQPLTFSEEDLQSFGIQKNEITTDPKEINCLRFALLTVKETLAKDLIFQKQKDDRELKQIFKCLDLWNYKTVSEAAPGDLVVYLQGEKPNHVGVYLGEDKVHSKIGIHNPYSHVHRLFALESNAIFFRKQVSE